MMVRISRWFPWKIYKIKTLQKREDFCVVFGCGETKHHGWVGIDGVGGSNVALTLDLRRKLPFRDCSAKNCYSEHFLEHLDPCECARHLKDVHRILIPGGRYRVVVPAAKRFMQKYIENDREFFSLAFPWAATAIEAVYHIVNWNGEHRNIFDFERLVCLGLRAGFDQVKQSEVNKSEIESLRIDRTNPQRVAESLYIEMLRHQD